MFWERFFFLPSWYLQMLDATGCLVCTKREDVAEKESQRSRRKDGRGGNFIFASSPSTSVRRTEKIIEFFSFPSGFKYCSTSHHCLSQEESSFGKHE